MAISLYDWATTQTHEWANNIIQHWNNVFDRRGNADIMQFVVREIFENNSNVDMRQVVGQWEHYAGQTWLDAVKAPQYKPTKMSTIFRLYEENQNYYFDGSVANGICLSSLNGGPWFSVSGGNHRTIVAKFASERQFQETGSFPLVAGVSKHHYFADVEAWGLFGRLVELVDQGIHISVHRKKASEGHVDGHQTIDYELNFHVSDYRFSERGRAEWLSAKDFCEYARYTLRANAVLTRLDWLVHFWRWWRGDLDSLIYLT